VARGRGAGIGTSAELGAVAASGFEAAAEVFLDLGDVIDGSAAEEIDGGEGDLGPGVEAEVAFGEQEDAGEAFGLVFMVEFAADVEPGEAGGFGQEWAEAVGSAEDLALAVVEVECDV
jgi:hypothetical protein